MKFKFITLAVAALLVPSAAKAATERGNGGDAVVCRNSNNQITRAELLDYYEARVLRNIEIDLGPADKSHIDKFYVALDRLKFFSPVRSRVYAEELKNFEAETQFIPGVELVQIEDEEPTVIPTGCKIEQLAVQRNPVFPGDKRFVVSKDIWDKLDTTSKAGLILHEIIYREALNYKHKNSVHVRYFNAFIANPNLPLTLKTHFDAFKFIRLINFHITDFHGIRFSLDKVNYEMFNPEGRFIGNSNVLAYPGEDFIVINGQKLWVKNINFYENGNILRLSFQNSSYIDPDLDLTFSNFIYLYENGNLKEGFLDSYTHPISKKIMGGRTSFDKDGNVTRSELQINKLNGQNYHLVPYNSLEKFNCTIDEYGEPFDCNLFALNSLESWVIINNSKIYIKKIYNTKLSSSKIISGTVVPKNETYEVKIQDAMIVGSEDINLFESGEVQTMTLAKDNKVKLKVGNVLVLFGSKNQKSKLEFFENSNNSVKRGRLKKGVRLPLENGKTKKFYPDTEVEFNQFGKVIKFKDGWGYTY